MAFKNLVPEPKKNDTTGLTKDVGWEMGVRTTVPADREFVWDFMIGPGLPIWFGRGELTLAKNAAWKTAGGVSGSIRSFTMGDRIRTTWRPAEWTHDSVLQVTVREVATGTTIAFHQEQLADRDERRDMVAHWKSIAAQLEDAIADVY